MPYQMVRKANSLIEATYKLSAIEQKIVLYLVSTITPSDDDFKPYQFKIKKFFEFIGHSETNYTWLEENLLSLKNRNLRIVYENEKGKKVILNVNWLSSSKYVEGSGSVELRFDPNMKPFLLQLKSRFTNYHLSNVVQLKSQFSIRLYELLKQYEKIGKRAFGLYDLRCILGIDEDQYQQYTDFRKRVILAAQAELAEKTDICFTFKETRVSRKVDVITFLIKANALKPLLVFDEAEIITSEIESELASLLDLLPEIYKNQKSIRKMLEESITRHGFEYAMRNIVYTNEKSNAAKLDPTGKRGNYRAYLNKALNNDYGLAYMEDMQAKQEANEIRQKTLDEVEKQTQRELNQIDRERENREKARVFISSYTSETLQKFEEEARKRMSPESLARYLRKDVIGNFEFKRRLEDIVMEHTGICKPQTEAKSELPENKPEEKEQETAAE
ncbi:MAG: replication initiator protein [uncultured bacterium]|nr:MAG: replication initiator protein [uncultured bacterium]